MDITYPFLEYTEDGEWETYLNDQISNLQEQYNLITSVPAQHPTLEFIQNVLAGSTVATMGIYKLATTPAWLIDNWDNISFNVGSIMNLLNTNPNAWIQDPYADLFR